MISFFDCLIFLNSPFSSASLFHIWPSLALLSSSFALIFFAHNSSVFSCLAAFRFSARCLISRSLSIAEFIKVFNWFLFDPASFFVFVFIICSVDQHFDHSDKQNSSLRRCIYKTPKECTLSTAYRPFRALFYLKLFYSGRKDSDF